MQEEQTWPWENGDMKEREESIGVQEGHTWPWEMLMGASEEWDPGISRATFLLPSGCHVPSYDPACTCFNTVHLLGDILPNMCTLALFSPAKNLTCAIL